MKLGDKKPEIKPLHIFYISAIVIILLMNFVILPMVESRSIVKTDYSTFLDDVEAGIVSEAVIDDEYVYYEKEEDGKEVSCRVVRLEDADLVERLHDAGVKTEGTVPETPSIFLTLILSYVVPIVIFIFLGRWLSKKMMGSMG